MCVALEIFVTEFTNVNCLFRTLGILQLKVVRMFDYCVFSWRDADFGV